MLNDKIGVSPEDDDHSTIEDYYKLMAQLLFLEGIKSFDEFETLDTKKDKI